MTNLIDVLKSSRFQQLLIIAVLQSLVVFKIISGEQSVQLINIISGLFGASVVIRTVDRQTDAKAKNTTISMPNTVSSVKASTSKKK